MNLYVTGVWHIKSLFNQMRYFEPIWETLPENMFGLQGDVAVERLGWFGICFGC